MKASQSVLGALALLLAGVASGSAQESPVMALGAKTKPEVAALERPARLDVHEVSLGKALDRLSERSGVPVSFSPSNLPATLRVSCDCATMSVGDALASLLGGTFLRYREVDGHVLVFDTSRMPILRPGQATFQYAALGGLPRAAGASTPRPEVRQGTVTGRVLDALTQQPLASVNVMVVGTQRGTLTSADGRFLIPNVPAGAQRVRASLIGYAAQEQEVTVVEGQSATVDFQLQSQAVHLEEVVAVGYGTQRRRDVTGAVASVDAAAATRAAPIANVQQAMQGRVAGVQVTQSSSEPGGGVRMRIRGSGSINASNDPLYVIDGLPIGGGAGVTSNARQTLSDRNPLNALNPSDIESIEILKDAAATAIYGARGANGVVIITTKRGSAGGLQMGYEGYTGMQGVARKLELLDARQYMQVLNELRIAQNQAPPFSPEEVAAAGTGTDWQDEILRTAPMQNHQLSFSGGSEETRYYASFGYFDQDGIIRGSGIRRYTGRLNTGHDAGAFRFGVNLNSSVVEDEMAPGGIGINMNSGAIFAALQVPPTLSVRDQDGRFTDPRNDINNPVALVEGIDENARTTRIFGNVFGEYDLPGGLTGRLNVGTDRFSIRHNTYETRLTLNGAGAGGIAIADAVESLTDLAEFTLNLNRRIRDRHTLTVLGGTSYQLFRNEGFTARTQGFPSDVTGVNNLALGASYLRPTSYRSQNQLLSYLSRVNYDYQGRYLASLAFRADGSSRFGEENRFGYFPSLALGWRISDEPFLRGVGVLDDLKLRASYGITGNQEIGNYRSLLLLRTGASAVLGNAPNIGTEPSRLPNPALKWERTTQFNVGADFSLLEGRLGGSAEYYLKDTGDLLLDFPVPLSTGFTIITRNAGKVRNQGLELSLNTINLDGPVGWRSELTFSTLRNRVLDLAGASEVVTGGVAWIPDFAIIRAGDPIGAYYGYKVDGVVQQGEVVPGRPGVTPRPGDLKIRDINGDGVITADDRTILGTPFPDFTFGIGNSLSLGPVALRVFVQGVQGQEVFNANIGFSDYPINFQRNRLAAPLLNRWTPSNPTNDHPSFVDPASWAGNMVNSRAVEDASYIRLQNVSLTYTLPNRLLGERLRTANVYVTGQNLLTLTGYSGFNPDVSVRGSSNFLIDMSAYPLARVVTAGMSLGF